MLGVLHFGTIRDRDYNIFFFFFLLYNGKDLMVFTTGGITSVTLGYQPNTDYIWYNYKAFKPVMRP